MKTEITFFLFLFFSFAVGKKHENIWPHPENVDMTDHYFIVIPSEFQIISDSKCDLIVHGINRYKDNRFFVQDCSHLNKNFKNHFFHKTQTTFTNDKNHIGLLKKLTLKFTGTCDKYPHLNMNESYELEVDEKGHAKISSHSVWGILKGLETFSQLLVNVGQNQFQIQVVKISDAPRFPHRGMMIDSSRHFLPLSSIYQTLDAMEMNKLNALHWHLVDDQSFPFVSETFPQLHQHGAYNAETHIYTKADVAAVIEYARLRGIRVIAEFDTPGHTRSWGKGVSGLLTQCFDAHHKAVPNSFGPLDVTKNATYEFVEKLFEEIVGRFPDQYTHLGGDEVNFQCWASNPQVQAFMREHALGTDYRRLESYYIQKLVQIVERLKRSYIVWQEVFDDGVQLQADTVVQVWKGHEGQWMGEMERVTARGFKVLLSSPWYLNHIAYGTDWNRLYQADPLHFNASAAAHKQLVMGGEACMWGEWVDASNLISRTWPRASAVAERLWSPQHVNSVNQARPRFNHQHCRMQVLGLRVQPNEGPGYCACDHAM